MERFWSKVDRRGPNGCWVWTAGMTKGYGAFHPRKGQGVLAHRYSYELANGPIPTGLVIDHICHNPACVNPAHLRACTQKQNMENLLGAHRDSSSGFRGVNWCKRTNKWAAEVFHEGRKHWLGRHANIEDAKAAVVAKRLELFTHNDTDRKASA